MLKAQALLHWLDIKTSGGLGTIYYLSTLMSKSKVIGWVGLLKLSGQLAIETRSQCCAFHYDFSRLSKWHTGIQDKAKYVVVSLAPREKWLAVEFAFLIQLAHRVETRNIGPEPSNWRRRRAFAPTGGAAFPRGGEPTHCCRLPVISETGRLTQCGWGRRSEAWLTSPQLTSPSLHDDSPRKQ